MGPPRRLERWLGSAILLAAGGSAFALARRPSVQEGAWGLVRALGDPLVASRRGDRIYLVSTLEGVEEGLPVYAIEGEGGAQPVAHVVALHPGPVPRIRVRPAPGVSLGEARALEVWPPSSRVADLIDLALPEGRREEFGRLLLARIRTVWKEALLPRVHERLPGFLRRIDPREDTGARALVKTFAASAGKNLEPLLDSLASAVADAVEDRFDLWDRVGLLVKVVEGDASGLKRRLLPVARESALTWFSANETHVLDAIGRAVEENRAALETWAGGELLDAFREEILEPVLEAEATRLEHEGRVVLRSAAKEFIEAPGGGFRVRFATVLRHVLLGKDQALLLVSAENHDEGP